MNDHHDEFMDALLTELYQAPPLEPVLNRVQAAIQPVEPVTVKVVSHRRPWYSAITVLAATVMICLFALWPGETQATELLQRVVNRAEALEIREYDVTVQGKSTLQARLWVQGGDRFVLRLPALLPQHDAFTWVGSNGQQSWFVPAAGPVLTFQKPEELQDLLQQRAEAMPILRVATVTRRLQKHYQPPQVVKRDGKTVLLRLVQPNPGSVLLPVQVEIEASDAIIEKLTLQWTAVRSGEAKTMTFTLRPPATVAANWFDHAAHHAESRRVFPPEK
jgi:hypothetical protein